MAINTEDLKMYLTSLEPEIAQLTYSQSIGGYISASLVYPEDVLVSSLDLVDATINANGIFSGPNYLSVGRELITVDPSSSNPYTILNRATVGLDNYHQSGVAVRNIDFTIMFNNQFSEEGKQYRCIAIRNDSSTNIAYNVSVYIISQQSNKGVEFKIGLETPINDALPQRAATNNSSQITLIDTTLSNIYVDNHFNNAILTMTGGANAGQYKPILSYTASSNTFVLSSSLPYPVIAGDTYIIDAGPAQRVRSGVVRPNLTATNTVNFGEYYSSNKVSINLGSRTSGRNLNPNDVIYVWIERKLIPGYDAVAIDGFFVICNYYTQ